MGLYKDIFQKVFLRLESTVSGVTRAQHRALLENPNLHLRCEKQLYKHRISLRGQTRPEYSETD